MKKHIPFLAILGMGLLSLGGCKTYTIPVDSFKEQFDGMDSTQLADVAVRDPWGGIEHYKANPMPFIKCVDGKGQPYELKNSPSIEVRFTYGPHNSRTIFYFDRILVTDSTVTGVKSRLLPNLRKTIPLSSITKIEVQDGKKRYFYVKE